MPTLSRRLFIGKMGLGACGSLFTGINIVDANVSKKSPQLIHTKKLNIALCGLGNYAGMLAEGLTNSQYCRLAGIVTGHPEKARQWQKDYSIETNSIYNYENFDSIQHNPSIDLVYVVLPNGMHKEFVIRAAKAGKHVITEKPMATSVKDCLEMIEACNKYNVQLAVGYRLHFEPYHLEIKRLGQEKVFGQVRFIEGSLGYKTYDTNLPSDPKFNRFAPSEWRLCKSKSGGGPLMDLGIYCIQSSRYVLGEEPISVTAQFGTINNSVRFAEVEESISWQLRFPSGAIANGTTSYGFNVDRFFASADDGFFELSPGLSYGPFQGKTSKGDLVFPTINQQSTQLDEIGKLILQNKPLPKHITGEEGIKDIRIIEAIYKSASTGKEIQIFL